jgi:hypothetical protein
MKTFEDDPTVITMLVLLTLSISGCFAIGSNIGSTAADDQGNALKVDYQRPPDQSLNEFESFIEQRNMEVTSRSSSTLTASGNLGNLSRGENSQDIRMKVFARQENGTTSLIVVSEYMEPTSGEYKRASNDTGIMTTREETQTTEVRSFTRLERILISRYGGDNVEAIDSDLEY